MKENSKQQSSQKDFSQERTPFNARTSVTSAQVSSRDSSRVTKNNYMMMESASRQNSGQRVHNQSFTSPYTTRSRVSDSKPKRNHSKDNSKERKKIKSSSKSSKPLKSVQKQLKANIKTLKKSGKKVSETEKALNRLARPTKSSQKKLSARASSKKKASMKRLMLDNSPYILRPD